MSSEKLDRDVLDELRDATGDEFLRELVETFLAEAPGMIADLETASAQDDADAFRRAAHSIKSNANTFGAVTLAELAREMELSGRTDGIDELKSAYEDAATALKAALDG